MNTLKMELPHLQDSARQELDALRLRASELEVGLRKRGIEDEHSAQVAARNAVGEQWQTSSLEPMLGAASMYELRLLPEKHDAQMAKIVKVLQEKGISEAIATAVSTGNIHVMDDFHRTLVAWVADGLPAAGVEKKKYKRALSMRLYEVTLTQVGVGVGNLNDTSRSVREHMALMEQFLRGMMQMKAEEGEYLSFEVANPVGSPHTSVYIAVPAARSALLEKQLLGTFSEVRLTLLREDFNPFAEQGVIAGSTAALNQRPMYALRTYETFSSDPFDLILNAFSKIDTHLEGASVQWIITPTDNGFLKKFNSAIERVRNGASLDVATNVSLTTVDAVFEGIGEMVFGKIENNPEYRVSTDDPRFKNIMQKVVTPVVHIALRIAVSAPTDARAKTMVEDIQATFQQFSDTAGNHLVWNEVKPRHLIDFAEAFSFRTPEYGEQLIISLAELVPMMHVPRPESRTSAPEIRQDNFQEVPAPVGLPDTGTLLGINQFRGVDTPVYLQQEDRLRHFYVIGQTGTGKSHLLKNMIIQDIYRGDGVCFIDPHGNDVQEILSRIPPERADDVIYFDPAYTSRPMGLNMLEYDERFPEQKTLVVDELFGIFKKLFGAVPESMGPAFEQYFRNAALLVMDDPQSGNTLLDVARIFSDSAFRARKLAACKNPTVSRFWRGIALQASGEQALENYAPYVTNKFDVFTSNEIVRPIISQQKSAFNFREMMDNKKIFLVNLSKGRLGDLNANLLGLVIVGKFLLSALSRADSFGKELPTFYLHIDEFQNFATPSIATILSEARKYKLSLTVAHQFVAQLTDDIRNSVFGNVGSMCVFRIGATDAEVFEKQFAPTFDAGDLSRIDNYHAHIKLLARGQPVQPFTIHALPYESGPVGRAEHIKHLSYERYGRPREEVEAENTISDESATLMQG